MKGVVASLVAHALVIRELTLSRVFRHDNGIQGSNFGSEPSAQKERHWSPTGPSPRNLPAGDRTGPLPSARRSPYPRQPSDSLCKLQRQIRPDIPGRILIVLFGPGKSLLQTRAEDRVVLIICPRCHSNLRMKTLLRRLRLAPTAMEFSRFRHLRSSPPRGGVQG